MPESKTPAQSSCGRVENLFRRRAARPGAAMPMVVSILAITVSMGYAIARSSGTLATVATHETATARSQRGAESGVSLALAKLHDDPAWLGTLEGSLNGGDSYKVAIECSDDPSERQINAVAFHSDSSRRVVATHRVHAVVRRVPLERQPDAAVVALGNSSALGNPDVDIEENVKVVGRVKSRGQVRAFKKLSIERIRERHGRAAKRVVRVDAERFIHYSLGCSRHAAASLRRFGATDRAGRLIVEHAVLPTTPDNPLGVYFHEGDVVLGDSVFLMGTLVVRGQLTVAGNGIRISSVDVPRVAGRFLRYPAIVTEGDIEFGDEADCVRVSGVIAATGRVFRDRCEHEPKRCKHDHGQSGKDERKTDEKKAAEDKKANEDEKANDKQATVPVPVPMPIKPTLLEIDADCRGPAIQIDGAIRAKQVHLKHRHGRPFEIRFKADLADVSDAPGFHEWTVVRWRERDVR